MDIAREAGIGIPEGPEGITPGWLAAVLGAGGESLRRLGRTRIGEDEGFSGGRLYRLSLEPDGQAAGLPATLVVKLSSGDTVPRARLAAANRREVEVYGGFAGAGLPAPQCHFAAADPAGASVLVMEDLGGLRRVPFLAGCGAADADAAVDALAGLHARWWQDERVARLGPAPLLREFGFARLWRDYPARVAGLLGHGALPAPVLALGDFIAANEAAVLGRSRAATPLTLSHGDAQTDNLMFDDAPGGRGVVMLDWQFAGAGAGAGDLGNFLIGSLAPDLRRRAEAGFVARYEHALARLGVPGYGLAACRADYLRSVARKLHLTVAATLLLDNGGAAKAAWRRADLERLAAFCADHAISAETFD